MTLRKKCPRCGTVSTSNAYGAEFWGVQSKMDNKIVCKDCAMKELYDRFFGRVDAED